MSAEKKEWVGEAWGGVGGRRGGGVSSKNIRRSCARARARFADLESCIQAVAAGVDVRSAFIDGARLEQRILDALAALWVGRSSVKGQARGFAVGVRRLDDAVAFRSRSNIADWFVPRLVATRFLDEVARCFYVWWDGGHTRGFIKGALALA